MRKTAESERAKMITGAPMKSALFAALGVISSFASSFTMSAKGCSRPKAPVCIGPLLF